MMNFFKTTLLSLAGAALIGSASAQTIPNANFEAWQNDTISTGLGPDIIYQSPTGWTPLMGLFYVMFGGTSVNIAADASAQSGTKAAKLFTGADSLGCDLLTFDAYAGSIPTKLKGYYKFTGTGLDEALAVVGFSRYNTANQTTDTLAAGSAIFTPTTSYQPFEAPINVVQAGTPDSMSVYLSYLFGTPNTALTLDNLSFETATGIWHLSKSADITLYPNPTTDEISLKLDKGNLPQNVTISLYDINGKLLQTAETASADLRMDISALPANTYSLRIQHGSDYWVEKIVKK